MHDKGSQAVVCGVHLVPSTLKGVQTDYVSQSIPSENKGPNTKGLLFEETRVNQLRKSLGRGFALVCHSSCRRRPWDLSALKLQWFGLFNAPQLT